MENRKNRKICFLGKVIKNENYKIIENYIMLQLIMPPAAKIHFEMQKLQLIMPPAAQIHIFLYFQAAKRKIPFFFGCRYSAGTYLIFFVSKFGANSAKNHQNLN